MTVPNVTCANCGTNLSTDDLRGQNCKYCGTALPHHARAAEQAAMVGQVMQNMQAQAMQNAFGANPYYGQTPQNPMMGPYGAPMSPMTPMGMGQPQVFVNGMPVYGQAGVQIAQQTTKMVSSIMMIVVISIIAVTVLTIGGAVLAIVLAS